VAGDQTGELPGGINPGILGPGGDKGSGAVAGSSARSIRTFPSEMVSFFKIKSAAVDPGGGVGGSPMGDMPGMPMGVPGGAGGQGAAASKTTLKNGFDMKRYSELKPQARRVPVAVSLVIDQNHLSRVLTAFSNSKLRFLTTQVLVNRYPKNINPITLTAAQKTSDYGFGASPYGSPPGIGFGPGKSPFMPGIPNMPSYPGSDEPGMPGEPYGPMGDSFQSTDSSAAHVEVVIYGVVSLYSRFPARPSTGEDLTEGGE
jgi:hypothetical protein